jgi:two-component system, OmpR family, sensor histidine kinase TctE
VALELALSAVNRGIDLSLEGDGEASVSGQALLLHELVSNLVDNALHYTPRGGSVVLRVLPDAEHVVLEVEDSGPGIPTEDRDRVFAPFYRAASTMQANPGGSGLGLAIVRDIAMLHHAGLELDQGSGGRGLLVRVRFPRATPPPAA